MRSVLLEMENELNDLEKFVASSEAEELLLAILQDHEGCGIEEVIKKSSVIREGLTNKKRYVYSVSIVALYGVLERYVEKLVHAYLSTLSCMLGYEAMSNGIRKAHMEGSIEYLQELKNRRMKTEDTMESVIKKLAGCVKGDIGFELNVKAFTLRSGNMNRKRIEDICTRVEINVLLKRIEQTQANQEYEGRGEDSKQKTDEEVRRIFKEIDDIVEIRNAVAHGALQMDEIEDNKLVRLKIEKVRVFGEALYEVFEQEVWRAALEAGRMRQLGQAIKKYGENIVCFNLKTGSLRKGEWIVLERQEKTEPFRRGVVETMQVNGEDREEVSGGEGVQVGIGLSVRASKSGNYWIPERHIVELVSR